MGGFDGLIGQDALVQRLQQAIISGRVAHAYLITGAPGSGKKTLAMAFAQALFCMEDPGRACGTCQDCRRIEAGNHPDMTIVPPEAGRIKIDQVRRLKERFALQSYEGSWKAGIVVGAETMTVEAANSLLKLLEEPSGQAVIMLLSTSPSMLLPTIVSRCQRIAMKRIPRQLIASYLEREFGFSPQRAAVVAGLADGRLGQAKEYAKEENLARMEQILSALAASEGRGLEALRLAAELDADPEALEFAMQIIATWLRDMLLAASGCPQDTIVHQNYYDKLLEQSRLYPMAAIRQAVWQVEDAARALRANANRRLTLDALLYQLADLNSSSRAKEVYRYGKSGGS